MTPKERLDKLSTKQIAIDLFNIVSNGKYDMNNLVNYFDRIDEALAELEELKRDVAIYKNTISSIKTICNEPSPSWILSLAEISNRYIQIDNLINTYDDEISKEIKNETKWQRRKHMNKELESLKAIESVIDLADDSVNTYTAMGRELEEAIVRIRGDIKSLRKALTPPTADEVCLAIMKHYESKIVFYNEMAKTFNEVHLTRNEEVVSNYANGEVGINYNALPPHLITMIGKFYESLEGEKWSVTKA